MSGVDDVVTIVHEQQCNFYFDSLLFGVVCQETLIFS